MAEDLMEEESLILCKNVVIIKKIREKRGENMDGSSGRSWDRAVIRGQEACIMVPPVF